MVTKRTKLEVQRAQLQNERSSFLTHWKDLGEYVLPRRPRFEVTDNNKGDKRNQKIIDSTGTIAARNLRSGMMSGVTSPARPWFRLNTPDAELSEVAPVKNWLYSVERRMLTVMGKSNLYNVLPIIYGDMGVFGTAAMMIEEDFDQVIRCYPFPIGSYTLASNDKLQVNVFNRDFRMTVRQLVQKFGRKDGKGKVDWTNFSDHVKQMWDRGEYETWIEVCHHIGPNEQYNANRLDSKFKKYTSCYYERGFSGKGNGYLATESDKDRYLSESGYDYFPVLAPRWEITGEDVYGTSCPGMDALGDVKQLQLGEKRAFQAIEKMVNPPMIAPTNLQNKAVSLLPGGVTYSDEQSGTKGFRPAHEVNIQLQHLEEKQQQIRTRIQKAFFEDLFLMLASSDRREITAREIEERHEEKLIALGPVLEQLNQDLLDPLIDIVFDIMSRQGLIPEAPEEIAGQELKVEYISMMAQAQKLVGISGVDRFTNFANTLIAASPAAADKINTDQLVDVYGDMMSIPPGVVRTDEEVEAMRADRAEAAKVQQQSETIAQTASAAKDLSQANLDGDNALTAITEQMGIN
jgi:hypothetical protein